MENAIRKNLYIGGKGRKFYIQKLLKCFLSSSCVNVKAKGRYISKAVTISESIFQKFPKRYSYKSIKIDSKMFNEKLVSTITISIVFDLDHVDPIKESFVVNEYITLEYVNRETCVYIDGAFCCLCYNLLDLDHEKESKLNSYKLFRAYSQKIQRWAYSYYDPKLMSIHLSLPVLKGFSDLGHKWADKLLKREILFRINNGEQEDVMDYYFICGSREERFKDIYPRIDPKNLNLWNLERCLEDDPPFVSDEYIRRVKKGENLALIAKNFHTLTNDLRSDLFVILKKKLLENDLIDEEGVLKRDPNYVLQEDPDFISAKKACENRRKGIDNLEEDPFHGIHLFPPYPEIAEYEFLKTQDLVDKDRIIEEAQKIGQHRYEVMKTRIAHQLRELGEELLIDDLWVVRDGESKLLAKWIVRLLWWMKIYISEHDNVRILDSYVDDKHLKRGLLNYVPPFGYNYPGEKILRT